MMRISGLRAASSDPHSFIVPLDGHGFACGFLATSKEVADGIWLCAACGTEIREMLEGRRALEAAYQSWA